MRLLIRYSPFLYHHSGYDEFFNKKNHFQVSTIEKWNLDAYWKVSLENVHKHKPNQFYPLDSLFSFGYMDMFVIQCRQVLVWAFFLLFFPHSLKWKDQTTDAAILFNHSTLFTTFPNTNKNDKRIKVCVRERYGEWEIILKSRFVDMCSVLFKKKWFDVYKGNRTKAYSFINRQLLPRSKIHCIIFVVMPLLQAQRWIVSTHYKWPRKPIKRDHNQIFQRWLFYRYAFHFMKKNATKTSFALDERGGVKIVERICDERC